MDLEAVRQYCLSFPHVTEGVQWEHDLLFRVGDKMFTVVVLEPSYQHKLSFKCTPEKFAELVERDGIIPAPYSARYHWVALTDLNALGDSELKELIKESYQMVYDKLPRKVKARLSEGGG